MQTPNFPQIPHTKKPGMMVCAVRSQRNHDRQLTVMLLAHRCKCRASGSLSICGPSALLTTLRTLNFSSRKALLLPFLQLSSLYNLPFHHKFYCLSVLALWSPLLLHSLFFPSHPYLLCCPVESAAMFSLLISHPTLDCSRCPWLYSISSLQ